MSAPRRWARAIAGLIVAALFLGLLARATNWAEVRRVLAGAGWFPLMLGLLTLAADMTVRITRWWWMLRASQPDLPFRSCVRPFLGSLALNNTVPLRAGDVLRVFGFRHTLRAPTAFVLGTLVLERVLDLIVLLLVLFASLLGAPSAFPRSFIMAAGGLGGVALLGLATVTLLPGPIARLSEGLLRTLFPGRRWTSRAQAAIVEVTTSLSQLRSPEHATRLFGASILAWLLEGSVFACVTWSLHLPVAWPAPWLALAAATLATLLPSSPGYVGTFDYFATLGLTVFGATHSAATAFALLCHLLLWLPVTSAGLFALVAVRSAATRPGRASSMLQADGLTK
jgi:glycosyltransferase 2 family protein